MRAIFYTLDGCIKELQIENSLPIMRFLITKPYNCFRPIVGEFLHDEIRTYEKIGVDYLTLPSGVKETRVVYRELIL